MKKYYQMIGKKCQKSVLIGIALIVFAFVIQACMLANRGMFDLIMADTNVFSIPTDEYKTGDNDYYKVDNNVLIDCYASDDEGDYYITAGYDSEGNASYLGFYVYDEQTDIADEIVDEYWDLIDTDDYPTTYLSGYCYVYNMSSDEVYYFTDWFRSMGMSEDFIDDLPLQTIVLIPDSMLTETYFSGAGTFGLILSILFIIAGLYFIISYLTESYRKPIENTIAAKNLDKNAIAADLDTEVLTGSTTNGYLVAGSKYALFTTDTPKLFVLDEIIWAYLCEEKTKHKLYGIIPLYTTSAFSVRIMTSNGALHNIPCNAKTDAEVILKSLNSVAPWAVYGYSNDLNVQFHQNLRGMIDAINNRKPKQKVVEESAPVNVNETASTDAVATSPVTEETAPISTESAVETNNNFNATLSYTSTPETFEETAPTEQLAPSTLSASYESEEQDA